MPDPISEESLRELLTEFFDERARVDAVTHGRHHAWIEERIEAERARREMYKEMTRTVISWSVPTLLGGLVYWLTHGGSWPR
ncbi:MAG: hypothetical protein PHW13_11955 [Methylococcales bacterium]|nr:hypothetical protein [Methylococcales bacterium]